MMSAANGERSELLSSPQEKIVPEDGGRVFKPEKLHGRAFYESLGSPRFVLAPMVDQSEFAWRLLTRSFMSPSTSKSLLAYTPMLHSRMFTETAKFRDQHFQPSRDGLADKPSHSGIYPQSDLYLDGNPSTDRPLVVQFCANNPSELLEAASYVAPFCDAVDLNLGCPQGIARKGRYGAFLQEDQELIYSLINTLHRNLSVPVTAKMRVLESKEDTLKYAQKILSAGASILTVHGRHRDQKGHKTGLADWSVIRYLREHLPKETVLFANGNVLKREDIERCLEETGADAVMSAEGNLYDPAIFGEVPPVGGEGREYWRGRDGKGGYRMDAVFRRYMDIVYKYVLEVPAPARKSLFLPSDPSTVHEPSAEQERDGNEAEEPPKKKQKHDKREKTTSPNLLSMQAHLFHLLRSLVSKHHHVRDALARCRAGDIAAFEAVLQMVEAVTRDALIEYERTNGKSVEADFEDRPPSAIPATGVSACEKKDLALDESSVETVKYCKRPWWICQPYVRPLPAEALKKGALHLSKKDLANIAEQEERKEDKERTKVEVENSQTFAATKASLEESLSATPTSTVDALGHSRLEAVNGGPETVEVPKEGLVCG